MAVDGKVLKGAIMDASKKSPLHLVQAFEPRAGLVLGQVEVDGKSNEITAIPALMEMLDLAGRTAAADAMHSQCETSARIVEKGGDCVLSAKGSQGTLHEDVQVWFSDPEVPNEMASRQHVDGGHGRVETSVTTVSHDVGWLQDRHDWPGLKASGKIDVVRELKGRSGYAELPALTCYSEGGVVTGVRLSRWNRERRWAPPETRVKPRTVQGQTVTKTGSGKPVGVRGASERARAIWTRFAHLYAGRGNPQCVAASQTGRTHDSAFSAAWSQTRKLNPFRRGRPHARALPEPVQFLVRVEAIC